MSDYPTRKLSDRYKTQPLNGGPQNNGGGNGLLIILGLIAGLVLCIWTHC